MPVNLFTRKVSILGKNGSVSSFLPVRKYNVLLYRNIMLDFIMTAIVREE